MLGLFIFGGISFLGLGYAFIAIFTAGFVFLTMAFSRAKRDRRYGSEALRRYDDPAARRRVLRTIRLYTAMIVVLPLALAYGLWDTRGGPLLPRISGTIVNVLMTYGLIRAVGAERAKLKR